MQIIYIMLLNISENFEGNVNFAGWEGFSTQFTFTISTVLESSGISSKMIEVLRKYFKCSALISSLFKECRKRLWYYVMH